MVLLDEKSSSMIPPPQYLRRSTNDNSFLPPFPGSPRSGSGPPTLSNLPAHILLLVVYLTFPQTDYLDETRVERQRKTLFWLEYYLRLTNRALYIACMHVLRSTYLPAYESLIRPPYTSDPFPFLSPATSAPPGYPGSGNSTPATPADISSRSPVVALQRETSTLDLFIALKVREDVFADDTELHLESEERFKDLFDYAQPKSRLEDLVRIRGLEKGLISVGQSGSTNGIVRRRGRGREGEAEKQMQWDMLSVSFGMKKVGLMLTVAGRKRTIVEAQRESRMESLEVAARRLVRELETWLKDIP
jgi:hypothetical protein